MVSVTDELTGAFPADEVGQPKAREFRLHRASKLTKNLEPPRWIVKQLIPDSGLVEIFGASGSLKTFVTLDLCFSVATGQPWHGRGVVKGTVVYAAAEGAAGVRRRLRALEIDRGVEDYELFVSDSPMDLSNAESCTAVATAIRETAGTVSMLVIDTLHRSSTGNEDSAQDFAAILSNIDTVLKPVADVVCWVHHSGHAEANRSRGTSARYAALDTSIKVERSESLVTLEVTKQKDAEPLPPVTLETDVVDLGIFDDETSQPITSLVLRDTERKSGKPAKPLSKSGQEFIGQLRLAIQERGIPFTEEIIERESLRISSGIGTKAMIHVDEFRTDAYKVLDVSGTERDKASEAKKKAYQRMRKKLKDAHAIGVYDDHLWIKTDHKTRYGTGGTQRDI